MLKRETKICLSCGRYFAYQKRWRKTWSEVRYCSKRCRREKLNKSDLALENTILNQLAQQPRGSCVSLKDIFEPLALNHDQSLNERYRSAARRLVLEEKLEILKKGRVIDPTLAKGSIDLRLC